MIRPLLFILALVLVGLFAAFNWGAFSTPTTLTLFFTTVQAPVGVIMLVLLAIACVVFVAWAIAMQGRALMDSRRMTKDLQAQRDLADKAEASRFTELRTHLDTGLAQLQRSVENQGNSLAAQMAQIDDRMHGSARPTTVVDIAPARYLRALTRRSAALLASQLLAAPVDVVTAQAVEVGPVQHPRQHEQQVAQPIQVLARLGTHRTARTCGCALASATTDRSARRATVRATCAIAALRVPAGRMNSTSRGSSALKLRQRLDRAATPRRPSAVRSRGSTARRRG